MLLKSFDVKYVTLHDLDEVVELLESLDDEEIEIDDEPEDPDNEFKRYVHGEISPLLGLARNHIWPVKREDKSSLRVSVHSSQVGR